MSVFGRPVPPIGDLAALGLRGRRTGFLAPVDAPRNAHDLASVDAFFSDDDAASTGSFSDGDGDGGDARGRPRAPFALGGALSFPAATHQLTSTPGSVGARPFLPGASPDAGVGSHGLARAAAYVLNMELSRLPSPPAHAIIAADTPADQTPRKRCALLLGAAGFAPTDPSPTVVV